MTERFPPETIFGLPFALPLTDALLLLKQLQQLWEDQFGRAFSDLDDDLDGLSRFFDPIATGNRLRVAIADVRPARVSPADGCELWMAVGDGRFLVTPEGRLIADYLIAATRAAPELVTISRDDALALEHHLRVRYRTWSQRRLKDVVHLLEGGGSAMLPQSIGAILLLLVNRSTSRERALPKLAPKTGAMAKLDSGLNSVVDAFTDVLAPSEQRARPRSPEQYSLYSGYALTEARRRLGGRIANSDKGVWIEDSSVDEVIKYIAADLARRPEMTSGCAIAAFDALCDRYEVVRPELAAHGLAFSRTGHVRQLKIKFVSALQEALNN